MIKTVIMWLIILPAAFAVFLIVMCNEHCHFFCKCGEPIEAPQRDTMRAKEK